VLNQVVSIETPRRTTGIVQCTRCQQYGHSKTYCNKHFVSGNCGGKHNTAGCKKPRDTPATCALCNGPHTANYKGCENYHHLLRVKGNENNRLNLHTTVQMPPPHLFHRLPRGVKRTLTPTLSKENTPLIQPTTTTKAIHFIRFEQNSKLCFINYCKKTAWR